MRLTVPCRLCKVWISTDNSVKLILIQDLKISKQKQCDTDSKQIPEKKQLQQFRKEYTDQFSFIIKGKNKDVSAFCTVCNSEFSIKIGGLNDITKHADGQKHKKLLKQKASMPFLNSFF